MAFLADGADIDIDESSDCPAALTEMRKAKHYLVSLFREQRCLWDPADPSYKNKQRKHIAWQELASSAGKPVSIVRAEINKLRSQFLREHKKVKKKTTSPNDIYVPKWYLYSDLLFLASRAAISTSHSHGNGTYNCYTDIGGQDSDFNVAREEDDRDSWAQMSFSSNKYEGESVGNSDAASTAALPVQQPTASASRSARDEMTAQFAVCTPTSAHLSASATEDRQRNAGLESSSQSNKSESEYIQRLCLELLVMEAKRASSKDDVFTKFGRFVGDTLRQRPSQFEQLQRKIVAVLFDFNEQK